MKLSKQTCVIFLLLLLLVSFTTWANAGTQPVTIETVWTFSDTVGDEQSGLWLAGINAQEQRELAFVWYPVQTAWWPTWQMALASDTGLLPLDNAKPVSVPGWPQAVGMNLGSYVPKAGHAYQSLLSYDPRIGSLSVSLIDLDSNETVYAHTFRAPVIDVDLKGVSGLLDSGDSDVTISDVTLSPYYAPTGTYWRLNPDVEDDGILSYVAANPQDELYLHLIVPDPAPQGQYRLIFNSGEFTKELVSVEEQKKGLLISLADLPLGMGQLTLEYLEQGVITFAQSRSFSIGRADVEISKTVVNREDAELQSSIILRNAPAFNPLDVFVKANIVELVWNTDSQRYVETPYSQEIVPVATDLILNADDMGLELPIRVHFPQKPGMYRISYAATVSPEISVTTLKQLQSELFNTYTKPEPVKPGDSYTIAVLPDTQYMVAKYPFILTRLNQWLMENAQEQGISLILQVGDVTDNNTPPQWVIAQENYSQLDGVLPYVLTIGNHDMSPGQGGQVAHRYQSLIKDYFPPAVFVGLQGSFPLGRLDNTYHTFNIAGIDYLVLTLEFAPPDEALEWANQVVAAHPDHKVIVVTHYYLTNAGNRAPQGRSTSYPMGQDTTTTMNDGAIIWYNFIRKHPNIAYVFSGHTYSNAIPWNIGYGEHGNMVYEFLIDFQSEDYGGNGYFALFEFTPDNKLNVKAYSPFLGVYKNDPNQHGYTSNYTVDLSTGSIVNH
jgi:hypothetical protein